MKKLLSLFLIFGALLSLTGCNVTPATDPKAKSKTVSDMYFNTVSVISSYGEMTDEEFNTHASTVEKTLEYYHKQFDIYFEYSGINNLCTVNKNAGISPVKVDAELIDFLLYCKELFTLTNGKTMLVTDYASAGKLWNEESKMAVWMLTK